MYYDTMWSNGRGSVKWGFASFCNILISLVPYSYSILALTYPQGADMEVSLESGDRCMGVA